MAERSITSTAQAARVDWLAWVTAIGVAICTVTLAGLSVARYEAYTAGMYDLGNMVQAIASVTRGEPLLVTSDSGNTSRLAGHVEIIYVLLALPYALWPDPRLPLIIQAVLFGLGALPVYRLAHRRGDSFIACCLTLMYLFYPVAQTAVLFDLHGDTLAMPIVLFALDALDRRAYRRYAVYLALALSCKVYVAIPVALLGLPIWWYYRQRRVAVLTTAVGVVYGAIAFLGIRAIFTTAETAFGHRGLNYITFYFGQLEPVIATFDQRLVYALIVFGPALLLVWRSWLWLLPGLPVAGATLLSNGPGEVASIYNHHYALVVPFIIMASIKGARPLQTHLEQIQRMSQTAISTRSGFWRRGHSRRNDIAFTCVLVVFCNSALVDTPLNPRFWMNIPNYGLDHSVYGVTPRDSFKDRFLAEHIPPEAALIVSNLLAPHLANRETLYVVRFEDSPDPQRFPSLLPRVDYVLADGLFDLRIVNLESISGGAASELEQIRQIMRQPDFGLVKAQDGLLLFQKGATDDQALVQKIETLTNVARPHTQFGDAIGLVNARVTKLSKRMFRATFDWTATASLEAGKHYVAVSRLDGVENERIVHLPTYALLPVTEWQSGVVVRETFDIELPGDLLPGRYTWRVAWYDLNTPEGHATDARSQIGESIVVADIDVP